MQPPDRFRRLRTIARWALFGSGVMVASLRLAAAVPAAKSNVVPAQTPRVEDGVLALRVALSHAAYNQAAPRTLTLKVDLLSSAAPPTDRPPLNLALVLDRSGSMAEDKKFAYTIEAARAVIENLSERDIVSLVAYNERALVRVLMAESLRRRGPRASRPTRGAARRLRRCRRER